MKVRLSSKSGFLLLVFSLAALGGFFVAPALARAELVLPTTLCDYQQEHFEIYNVNQHLSPSSVRENGTTAFSYGFNADNNFVSKQDNIITFRFHTLFDASAVPYSIVKLTGFYSDCTPVFGLGPTFQNLDPSGNNTLIYSDNGYSVSLNGQVATPLPAGNARYIWIEVWDGKKPTDHASYSYLVDIQNPQNPSGTPDEPSGKRPVLIVPGVVGTELYNGDDLIWPDLSQMLGDINDQFLTENLSLNSDGSSIKFITTGSIIKRIALLNIFDSLISDLLATGYIEEHNLFLFPYDWRLNLDFSQDLLNKKIEEIKSQTGFKKVDIIAHSMGGFLVKDYLAEYGKNNVNKLVFVGTPHLGAPKAARVLLYGDRFGIYWLEEDRIQEIAVNSPASYELLPSQKYFDQFVGYIRKDFLLFPDPPLNYSDTKNFLLSKGLNSTVFGQAESFFSKNLQDLDFSGIDTYNIAGCRNNTPAGYQYGLGNWFINSLRYTSGDNTVPLVSADYLNITQDKKFYIKKGSHAELPSFQSVRNLILGILNGNISTDQNEVSSNSSFCNFKGKEMVWKSPVEVHIYDSQGHHTGPIENNGIEYGIEGVSYEIIDHRKFVFLPTGEGQNYHIVARGLENGSFDLRLANNDNGIVAGSTIFNDIPVTNLSFVQFNLSDQTADNIIQVDENGTGDFQNVAADSTLNPVQSEDMTPPQTQVNITSALGQNGWYTSTTTITLTVADENSGILYTKFSLDNGNSYNFYNSPITLAIEGLTILKYYSVDRAGNNEEVQTKEIRIDKTSPELTAGYDLTSKDFIFSAIDNLDSEPNIVCTENSCQAEDEAGNKTVLTFKREKKLIWNILKLNSITYNDVFFDLNDNLLIVKLLEIKKTMRDFDQTFLLKGQELSRINYNKNKNQSTIFALIKGGGIKKEVVKGIKILQLETKKSIIKTNIK